jgi:phenylalanyl-tRNA synthetase alpha chain
MSSSLHPIERRVLSTLARERQLGFESLVSVSGLNPDQVRRSLQWLSSKGLVALTESKTSRLEFVSPPPEVRLANTVLNASRPIPLGDLRATFSSNDEFSAALGRAKKEGWIVVEDSGSGFTWVRPGNEGRLGSLRALNSLLQHLSEKVTADLLPATERVFVADLSNRGFVKELEQIQVSVAITDEGLAEISTTIQTNTFDRLTPELLTSGAWKGKVLRSIDVQAKAPVLYPGRRHPVRDFIREVKETYISMGFTELEGNSVHPAFWNFDALFIPQDHPGRDMQDTFYLEGLSDKKLQRKGAVANVAATHESGWKTGSRGWGYSWNIEEARRLVLRTHNTVLTVKALSESREKETRVFAVSKVYRNENLDYKHLAEFYQMDGIIVGKGLNLRHLMGFLMEFYKKLGMKAVKLWPTYFPYTEPSLQVVGYSDAVKTWIELSGSGVFRPEVTIPLGVRVPVLAWGPGIERLMLMRFGLDDMRDLYGNDLSWLRNRVEIASR